MKVPEWFKRLFLPLRPDMTVQEVESSYSDYMRIKYGIAKPFSDEDSK